MTKVEYTAIIKDGLMHIPDQYTTMTKAAQYLGISHQKLEKMIEADMLVWDQPKMGRTRYVEKKGLVRLKYPETEPVFEPLKAKDARDLQNEIDIARHKIASAANLPPGAVKIFFDLGEK
ncbi:MAG: hypothetical protein RBR86_07555 [Pseudobdellovibrionaceae bacterium]|nr:hypothetical protein [Pseudobdellovibrionaceae bacterium]